MEKESFFDKLKKVLKKIFYKQPKIKEPHEGISQMDDSDIPNVSESLKNEQEVYKIDTNIELAPKINVVDTNQGVTQASVERDSEPAVLIGDEKPKTDEIIDHVPMIGDEKVEDLPQETLNVAEPKVTLGDPIEWKKPEASAEPEQPLMFNDEAPIIQNNIEPVQQTESEQPLLFGDGENKEEVAPQVEAVQPIEQPTSEQPLWFGDPIKEEAPVSQEPIAPIEETVTNEPVINESTPVEPIAQVEPAEPVIQPEILAPAEPVVPVEPTISTEPVMPVEQTISAEPIVPAEPTITEQPQIQEQPLMFGDPEEPVNQIVNEPVAPVQENVAPVTTPDQGLHFPSVDPDFGEQSGPSAPGLK